MLGIGNQPVKWGRMDGCELKSGEMCSGSTKHANVGDYTHISSHNALSDDVHDIYNGTIGKRLALHLRKEAINLR